MEELKKKICIELMQIINSNILLLIHQYKCLGMEFSNVWFLLVTVTVAVVVLVPKVFEALQM